MAKTVFDVLIMKHEEDVASSTQFLVGGGAKSFDEYREVVGRIRGLQLAIQTTKDLSRSQMEEDDDD
jgi:hypothetical protein